MLEGVESRTTSCPFLFCFFADVSWGLCRRCGCPAVSVIPCFYAFSMCQYKPSVSQV